MKLKNILKQGLSFVLGLVLMLTSVNVAFANNAVDGSVQKISAELQESMNNIETKDEKIAVTIWYTGVEQAEIDEQVGKNVGFTLESLLENGLKMPSEDILSDLIDFSNVAQKEYLDDIQSNMESYLRETNGIREKEWKKVKQYIKEKRKVAKDIIVNICDKFKKDTKIKSEEIWFESDYVPMIVAEMSCKEIEKLAKEENVSMIELHHEIEISDPPVVTYDQPSVDSLLTMKKNNGFTKAYEATGLTGKGVVMGLLDHGVPYEWGSEIDYETDNIEIVGVAPNQDDHAVNSARIIFGKYGIAPDIEKVYCAGLEDRYTEATKLYYGVESLVEKGVHLINASINTGDNRSLSYTDSEKWLDYIIEMYGVTFVQSAGNNALNGNGKNEIYNLGLCYNTITVGAFNDKGTLITSDDVLYDYSSYRNLSGCFKPDFIASGNLLEGGTSSAAPVVTGTIALMLELKPALAAYPQLIKSILMASCHRKSLDPIKNTQTETMSDGLTNKQGTGIIDPYRALAIIGNNQYGVSLLDSENNRINIVQPKYDSNNMNISVAWLQSNTNRTTNYNNVQVDKGVVEDLDLSVYNDSSYWGFSEEGNSSSEMAYVSLSKNSDCYTFKIYKNKDTYREVLYAYAWSTDNMRYYNCGADGLYYLKNKKSLKYLDINSSGSLVQTAFEEDNSQMWVLKKRSNNYWRMVNVSNDKDIAGGTKIDAKSMASVMKTNTVSNIAISNNSDGSKCVSISNPYNGEWGFLTPTGGSTLNNTSIYWTYRSYGDSHNWYLEKVNYCKGDIDMNGTVDMTDVQSLLSYSLGTKDCSEASSFLGDMNCDGSVTIADTQILQNIALGIE